MGFFLFSKKFIESLVTEMLVLMAENVYVSEIYDNAGKKIVDDEGVATSFTVWVGQLIEKIMTENAQGLEDSVEASVILIGSFQNSLEANDVDLIIVYDELNIESLKALKTQIASKNYEQYKIPVDYTTLSRKEYNEMTQLRVEKHIIIFDAKSCDYKTNMS